MHRIEFKELIDKYAQEKDNAIWQQIKEIIIHEGKFDCDEWFLIECGVNNIIKGNEIILSSKVRLITKYAYKIIYGENNNGKINDQQTTIL